MNSNENHLFSFFLQDHSQQGVTSLVVKMAGLPETEPLRWKLQMLLAIKGNNPFEAFRVAGSHIFEKKNDPIVLALLQCATELIELNNPGMQFNLPSPTRPVFAVPAMPVSNLTNFVKTVLRNHMLKHGKLSGQEALEYAIKYRVQICDVKAYCDFTCEKMTRNVIKQFIQATNATIQNDSTQQTSL